MNTRNVSGHSLHHRYHLTAKQHVSTLNTKLKPRKSSNIVSTLKNGQREKRWEGLSFPAMSQDKKKEAGGSSNSTGAPWQPSHLQRKCVGIWNPVEFK